MKDAIQIAIALPLAAAIAIPLALPLAVFTLVGAVTVAHGVSTGDWSADLIRVAYIAMKGLI